MVFKPMVDGIQFHTGCYSNPWWIGVDGNQYHVEGLGISSGWKLSTPPSDCNKNESNYETLIDVN